MNRQSVTKAQKPKNSTLLPATDILQHQAINRTDYSASAVWLVAQHSICTPDLQRKFFKQLSEAVEKGDAPKRQVAGHGKRKHNSLPGS